MFILTFDFELNLFECGRTDSVIGDAGIHSGIGSMNTNYVKGTVRLDFEFAFIVNRLHIQR